MNEPRALVAMIAMLAAGCAATPPTAARAPGQGATEKGEAAEEEKAAEKPGEATAGKTLLKPGEATAGKTPSKLGKTLAEHEADYKSGCGKKPELAAYCQCGWGVFSKALTLDQMNADSISDAMLDELTKKTTVACGDKMPESVLREGFMEGCTKGEPGMQAYCECFWPEVTARFSLKEIASDQVVGTPKHAEANKAAMNKCASKVPEASVKTQFMKGCGRGEPAAEKFCACAWKETRSVMSPAQIQATSADSPELQKAQKKIERACARLRPAR